jgi:hypothetical protein
MNQQQQQRSQSIEGLTLGQRIVLAARLAVAKHLADSIQQNGANQQIVIGGAGPARVKDDRGEVLSAEF